MKMPVEIADAMQRKDDRRLYHELYDIYDKGSGEAVKIFEQWKSEVKPYEKNMIERTVQDIYDNESAINKAF